MLKLPEKTKLSTLALSDPFTKETEAKRTHLMFAACASILIAVYGLKLNKTPWLDIEVPVGAPNILQGGLAVAVAYTLVVFVLHSWTDFTRWWIARESIEISGYRTVILQIQVVVNSIGHHLSQAGYEYREMSNLEVAKSQAHASASLERLLHEIAKLQRRHTILTMMQFARLAVLDIGLPITIGIIALVKTASAIGPFLAAIVR